MAGYLIAELDIIDQDLFAEFADGMTDLVKAQNGKYLVRGGESESIEGDWSPQRVAVIEFESYEQVQDFVKLPEYQELAKLRSKSSNCNTIIVDGV